MSRAFQHTALVLCSVLTFTLSGIAQKVACPDKQSPAELDARIHLGTAFMAEHG